MNTNLRFLSHRALAWGVTLAVVAGFGLATASSATAADDPAGKCEQSKAKSAGKHATCRSGAYSAAIKKALAVDAEKLTKCSDKISSSFTKAEDKAAGACTTNAADVLDIEDVVDACIDDVVTALGGAPGAGGDNAKCQSAKTKEAGKYASCRLKAVAKGVSDDLAADFTKCEEKFSGKWTKLEEKPCATTGDQTAIKADLDACTSAVATAIDDIEDPVVGYSQDFESLAQASGTALSGDGWLVFANVFDGNTLAYMYGYGPFAAPNGGDGFCGIDVGQGGAEQGTQQLVVYNNYADAQHAAGNLIEASVFRERTIVAGDSGRTLTFAFDAKKGNINDPSGNTTAIAFIKVLKQSDFTYATLAFPTVSTTALPASWSGYSVSVNITPAMVGELLQFGFSTTATDYDPSGVFYDNIVVSTLTTP